MHYDQRQAPRKRLQNFLQIYDAETQELLGRLVDISATGLMLISSEPVPVGRQLRLRVHLPQKVGGRQDIELEAISMWSRSTSHTEHHGTGFHFTKMDRDDQTLLEQILNETA